MEQTAHQIPDSAAEAPISQAERCVAVAIKVMKPTDGNGLDMAVAYARKMHVALLEMEREERRVLGLPGAPKAAPKPPNRVLTPDELATIERMAKTKASVGAISRATKVALTTIRGVIARNGWRVSAPAQESGAASGVIGRGDRADDVGGTAATSPGPAVALPPAVADAAPGTEIEPVAEAAETMAHTPILAEIAADRDAAPKPVSDTPRGLGSIPAEEAEKYRPRYEAGERVATLAAELNVTKQTFYNLAAKYRWVRPAQTAPAGTVDAVKAEKIQTNHHRAWSEDKTRRFTEAWLRGDNAEFIGAAFAMEPGTVAAAAAGLGIADDPRRRAARQTRLTTPSSKPAPVPAPVAPAAKSFSPARQQAIDGVGDFLARKSAAAPPAAVKPAGPPLPDGEPDRLVMALDGPDLAKAVRRAGFTLDQIAGSQVPQWRIRGAEIIGLLELRRVVAGLRLMKAAE